MKIAICDDDIREIEKINAKIKTHRINHEITKFTSAIPLLKHIEKGEQFDVLFLDVQMPDTDGWQIAKQLKIKRTKIYIAMVTIMSDYIYDSFDRVDWFAPKPVCEKKIHQILDNAQERIFPDVLSIKIENIPVTLTASEIKYIEVHHNELFIHTANQRFITRMSLKEMVKLLHDISCFVQIHQSHIVNLDYYSTLRENQVVLRSGEQLTLARGRRKSFLTALKNYI